MPTPPRGLLLDFGGVIAESERSIAAPDDFVTTLHDLIGGGVSSELIGADLEAGAKAYSRWRDAMARPFSPTEITHEQFWRDFVCADWPARAQAAVLARASELAYRWTNRGPAWRLRDGVVGVLDTAAAAGIPVAVVSNTLCGAPFRDFLARAGVGDRFAAQVYSDEAGVRKPNPAMIFLATRALGLSPADVWFAGDTPLRDILAARRAGVGYAILVRSDRERRPDDPRAVPDASVESMVDVHRMLREVFEN